jgi:hypothetical protein
MTAPRRGACRRRPVAPPPESPWAARAYGPALGPAPPGAPPRAGWGVGYEASVYLTERHEPPFLRSRRAGLRAGAVTRRPRLGSCGGGAGWGCRTAVAGRSWRTIFRFGALCRISAGPGAPAGGDPAQPCWIGGGGHSVPLIERDRRARLGGRRTIFDLAAPRRGASPLGAVESAGARALGHLDARHRLDQEPEERARCADDGDEHERPPDTRRRDEAERT